MEVFEKLSGKTIESVSTTGDGGLVIYFTDGSFVECVPVKRLFTKNNYVELRLYEDGTKIIQDTEE